MMADQVVKQNQWEAGPDEELKIPEALIRQLKYEIVVFTQRKEFTFRCSNYKFKAIGVYRFSNVIIDTSKLNPKGEVELKRVTYHPEIFLANVPFMIVPAPEEFDAD